MLISLLILLLLSNALTIRRDQSILFSRVVIIALVSTSFLASNNLFLKPFYKGLFNVTTLTQTFNIFIFLVSAVILTLTALFSFLVINVWFIPENITINSFLYNNTSISVPAQWFNIVNILFFFLSINDTLHT